MFIYESEIEVSNISSWIENVIVGYISNLFLMKARHITLHDTFIV